jgi:hypothetical protein
MSEAAVIPLHEPTLNLGKVSLRALIVGAAALALVAAIALAMGEAKHLFHAYLVAYLLWFGLTLGCIALGLLHTVVGGRWGDVVRPLLETGARAAPLMAVLFVPLLFGLRYNYPWARHGDVESDPILKHQTAWMNTPLFIVRFVVYFVIWIALAYVVNLWSRRKTAAGDLDAPSTRLKGLSGPGLLLYGLTVSMAAIDWAMSLQKGWYSTIFGLSFIAGQGLTAMAFVTLVLVLISDEFRITEAERPAFQPSQPATGKLAPRDFNDLGNLLLTFTMLWAYLAFSQFLITWAGNLPEEVAYYTPRMRDGWQYIGLALIVFHFFAPFFMLLTRRVKRNARRLGILAAWILVMRLLDLYWIVQPSVAPKNGPRIHTTTLLYLLAPIGIGGIWVAFFAWQLRGRRLLPEPAADAGGHHG